MIIFDGEIIIDSLRPLYLLADSQLLFVKKNGRPFFSFITDLLPRDTISAAYIGASNGDRPEFYGLFEAAMEKIGVSKCNMIRADFSARDRACLEAADIVLLAGGDVVRGWRVFESVGMDKIIVEKYREGAFLIGISAGAVQLGWGCGLEEQGRVRRILDTFRIVPYLLSPHDEKAGWPNLKETVMFNGPEVKGIGIPTGGGIIYSPDQSLMVVRKPAYEVSVNETQISERLIEPDAEYSEELFL